MTIETTTTETVREDCSRRALGTMIERVRGLEPVAASRATGSGCDDAIRTWNGE